WDMKTGGILSRLTGDVETTTGLLQMAIVSPAVSLIRLAVAVAVLLALNWRLALTALAIVPAALVISFIAARRVRPIYRSIGDVRAFQWYPCRLLGPGWQIVNSFSELQRSLAAMERVFDVLAMDDDKPDRPGARDAPPVVDEIRFDTVEFAYREGQPVVRDFDVVVPGGSVIALVGRSGAGETTVTDLVARFHDPTRRRILLQGVDIRDFRLRSYRELLAIVQQDVFLFD